MAEPQRAAPSIATVNTTATMASHAVSMTSEGPLVNVHRQATAFPPSSQRRKGKPSLPFRGGNKGPGAFWKWFFGRKDGIVFLTAVGLIGGVSIAHAVLTIPFLTARSSIIIPILFGYLLVNTLVQLFKTTLTDPGYLPIDLHLDPTYTGPASAIEAYERSIMPPLVPSADPKPSADFGSNLEGQPFPSYDQPTTTVDESPLPRGYPFLDASFGNAAGSQQPINVVRPVLPGIGKIEINGVEVKIKYCHTCRIWRPPRTSHCSTCDRCVEVHDHHCPWTANCIGKRNYRHFFAFLFFCTLLDLFVWSSTLAHIVLIADEKSRLYSALWSDTVAAQPLLVVIQVFTTLIAISFLSMTPFHIFLTINNLTTNEHIKRRYYYDDPDVPASGPRLRRHPFHKGSILSNVSWVICRPIESSHLSDYMPLPTSPSTTTAPPPQIVYEILEESTDAVTLHVEEERAEIKPGKFIKSQ